MKTLSTMNRRNGETENRRRAVAASPARSPRRLPPDDFGDAFGVNQHQLGVSEEDNFAIVLRGAEVPRLAKGVLGPVGEPDSERPERFSFRDLFESDCVHGCKLPPPPARANNKTKREKRAHPSGRGGLQSLSQKFSPPATSRKREQSGEFTPPNRPRRLPKVWDG